ncbi:hypothetical protein OS493_018985 [Desmophyllum pertusum]|uniref:Uncharacterized protein n=1 Tax=Desmophyllum pertusum TaxID=174260 RepID=A0A9X0CSE5_9CNID|nr:hypothetical protein OS493_018985 [Desmophyllum pertusum]
MCYIELFGLELSTIASEAFKDVTVTWDLELSNSKISTFEENPFVSLTVTNGALELQNNLIQAVTAKMFSDAGSNVKTLDLSDNQIQSLHEDAFKGVTIGAIKLMNNKLVTFPSRSLRHQNSITELDLTNNQISTLPPGELDVFTNLVKLILQQNKIPELGTNLFQHQTNLQYLDLENNVIGEIQVGAFNNLDSIEYILLQANKIVFLPTFPSLSNLRTLNVKGNKIENIGQDCFGGLTNLNTLYFNGNNNLTCGLQCVQLPCCRHRIPICK